MTQKARKSVLIGLDSIIPRFAEQFMNEGLMPNLKRLKDNGFYSEVIPVIPPLTPSGWVTIATGAWPSTSGIEGFGLHFPGDPLDKEHSGCLSSQCKAEFLWNTAEKVGKQSIIFKYPVSWPPTIRKGIQVDGRAGYGYQNCNHEVAHSTCYVTDQRIVEEATRRLTLRPKYLARVVNLTPADQWTNVPAGSRPFLETEIAIIPTNPGTPRVFPCLMLEEDGKQKVLISRSRSGSDKVAFLEPGQWSEWIIDTFDTAEGLKEGSFKFKLMDASGPEKRLKLYMSEIHQITGYSFPESVSHDLYEKLGPFPEQSGEPGLVLDWIDDQTQMELFEEHARWMTSASAHLLSSYPWDLFFVQIHIIDYAQHAFWGGFDESFPGFDPSHKEKYWGLLKEVYRMADRFIGGILEKTPEDAAVTIISDHGHETYHSIFYVNSLLRQKGWLHLFNDPQTGDVKVDWSRTRAFAFGAYHIFINLKGRDPEGSVDLSEFNPLREEIIEALYDVKDPRDGRHPVRYAFPKEDMDFFGLYGGGVGDIVYSLAKGYWSGGGMPNEVITLADISRMELFTRKVFHQSFTGEHDAQVPFIRNNRCPFILKGPGILKGVARRVPLRLVDIAPTISWALGIPFPAQCEGSPVLEAFE